VSLRPRRWWVAVLGGLFLVAFCCLPALADPSLKVSLENGGQKGMATTLQIILLLTVLSLVPAILLMVTSFARIVVVLSFLRQAMSTPQVPPNQVMLGLALFLTLFVMGPTIQTVNKDAVQPYLSGQMTSLQALKTGSVPVRDFMLRQTREKDLALFVQLSKSPRPEKPQDLSLTVITPAFMISELKTAFEIGFMLYLPFLIIDLVVASVLMSMGMLMLPPAMISLPFKILLFVLVDGWNLVVHSLVNSFH
jgi:flagellar biosynthetic protein FliP